MKLFTIQRGQHRIENLKSNEQNSKQVWRYINEMIGRAQVKSKEIDELNGSNGIVHNSSDIANVLNDFFSTVGKFSNNNSRKLIEMLTETLYVIQTVKTVVSNSQVSPLIK